MKTREIAQAPQVRMTRRQCGGTVSHSWEGGRAARGRLTVGGRGVTPHSEIASALNRASRLSPCPPPGVPGKSYPDPAGPDPYYSASLHQNNKTQLRTQRGCQKMENGRYERRSLGM